MGDVAPGPAQAPDQRADEHADGNGRRLHADHSSGRPLGASPAPRGGVPVRAGGPRLRPASGLRRRDHRHLSLDAASRGEALRVGGRRRHLHTAEHHPPAFQCQRRQARAPDLGHQPDLQGLRAERPGAARGRAGVRPGRHSVRGAGWAVSQESAEQGARLTGIAAAQAAPRHAFRDVWLITVGHGLTHWYPATFYLLLPLIGSELGLTYGQIGLIMTCQYVAAAIANVPGGVLVDTVGRKGLLMAVSLFWVGFPYLLIGFTHSYAMLLACIALVGFGNSIWHPTAIPTLGQRYPERKGLVLSLHGMGGNVGDAVAPVVIGALLALFSWRQVVVMNVLPGLVVAVLILVLLGTLQFGTKHVERQSFAEYLRGLEGFFLYATRPVIQAWLLEATPKNMGGSSIGVLFGAQAIGGALGPLLAGLVADRHGLLATFYFPAATIVIANLFVLWVPKPRHSGDFGKENRDIFPQR